MDDKTKSFLVDLKELLEKHKVEITSSDESTDYPEDADGIHIRIDGIMNGISMDLEAIDFGTYIDSNKLSGMLNKTIKKV